MMFKGRAGARALAKANQQATKGTVGDGLTAQHRVEKDVDAENEARSLIASENMAHVVAYNTNGSNLKDLRDMAMEEWKEARENGDSDEESKKADYEAAKEAYKTYIRAPFVPNVYTAPVAVKAAVLEEEQEENAVLFTPVLESSASVLAKRHRDDTEEAEEEEEEEEQEAEEEQEEELEQEQDESDSDSDGDENVEGSIAYINKHNALAVAKALSVGYELYGPVKAHNGVKNSKGDSIATNSKGLIIEISGTEDSIVLRVLWSCVGRSGLSACKEGILCTTHMSKVDGSLDYCASHVSCGVHRGKGLVAVGAKNSVYL
jgi:hypothetical protein